MSLGGSNLGGGPYNGHSAKQTVLNFKDGEQALIRKQLRVAWNTQAATGKINGKNRIITPFRAVNNSGDFLARENYICGGSNPTHLHKGGIRHRFGSLLSQCDGSGVEYVKLCSVMEWYMPIPSVAASQLAANNNLYTTLSY